MRTSWKLISAIFAVALLGAPADAQQLAKSGKYTGKFAAHAVASVAQTYELDKGHAFFFGQVHGVFLNGVADDFIDKTEVICPVVNDIVGGLITAVTGTVP
jgi:hypothetical protein